jgi:DNA end-binding protein Ku
MARAVWSGSISFGLVNVPVKAYTAVRDHEVHFHQLDKETGSRIRYLKVSAKTGDEVEADDIVLGYELDDGEYVTFTRQELDALEPESTRTIDVRDFVPLEAIDPIYYERTYWLAPDGDAAERAYSLLVTAMDEEHRVGIGSVVMRNKQYLAAIRPIDGALGMSTMRFADEVVDASTVEELPGKSTKPNAKELELATQIVDALSSDWDPDRYHDTYTEELRDRIEAKATGEAITVEEAPAPKTNVVDLLAALQASVDAAKQPAGKSRSTAEKKVAAKKTASKRAAPKKKTHARKSA